MAQKKQNTDKPASKGLAGSTLTPRAKTRKTVKSTEHATTRVVGSALTQADADRFEAAAYKVGRSAAKSKKTARDTLVILGTHTKTGRLTKNYRG